MMTDAKLIEHFLTTYRISQYRLAKLLGLAGPSGLSRIVAGQRRVSEDIMRRLIQVFPADAQLVYQFQAAKVTPAVQPGVTP